jgi:hypothetical protein
MAIPLGTVPGNPLPAKIVEVRFCDRGLQAHQCDARLPKLTVAWSSSQSVGGVANFVVRVVRDVILDDGEQERRHFGVEAEVGWRKLAFILPAAEFGRMGWVLNELGPEAVIHPGQQQHARAASETVSRWRSQLRGDHF